MKYLNKYATTAAYTADSNRPTTESTVSLIEDGTGVKFDGKNVLVEKAGAGIGDICVYNKTLLRKQFIKLDTYNAATFPANLVIMGVVYYRTEDKVHIVATTQTDGLQWAAPFKAKLSGFDFATGGTFTITVNTTTTAPIAYTNTDNLTTTAALIATALNAGAANTALKNWTVAADLVNNCIIATRNFYTPALTIFTTTDGDAKITSSILCIDKQAQLTGFLTPYSGATRNDGSVSWVGVNFEKFYQYYYSNGGDTATNQAVGTGDPIRYSRYNLTDNPLIVNFYGAGEAGYAKYIQAKMTRYPYSKNAILDKDGKTNTDLLSAVSWVDVDLSMKPIFPAAYTSKQYGLAVEMHTTGLEAGNWWLPSFWELFLLIKDRKLDNKDALNRTLTAIGKTKVMATGYYWSSSEFSSYYSWLYLGYFGVMTYDTKYTSYSVRPVSAF